MSQELANLLAKRFIARTDVKAEQYIDTRDNLVKYRPIREKWTRQDLDDHIAGTKTFGHYIVNTEDECKLLCFDLDLNDRGWIPTHFGEDGPSDYIEVTGIRNVWHDRAHPARPYLKAQLRTAAHLIARGAEILQQDIAVAYSGNKGIHVYVMFTKTPSAAKARLGADTILTNVGNDLIQDAKNDSGIFYQFTDQSPDTGFPNISIEVFPKQDTVGEEGLGNLVRLPLGKNLKHTDPTFFIDMSSSLVDLKPVDAIRALTPKYNLWQTPEEAARVQTVTTSTPQSG